ncbi:MAG: ferrous iron transport protein B [Chloroflexi bacterium]|nr:ferrous iron transport protein B [Chloroflexota bacterium]
MTCHPEAPALDPEAPIVLVGNPNVGKSALFGALTGRYVEVSNFPGTTVEVSAGRAGDIPILDTPGVNSLYPRSDDERVTRNILLARPPRAVVQVADARNLRRSLLLTLQLAEFDLPFILDLNMADEARAQGITVDTARLAQVLGASIVETVATRKQGVDALRARLEVAQPIGYRIHYDGAIEAALARLAVLLPSEPAGARAVALMILAGDADMLARYGGKHTPALQQIVAETAAGYSQPLNYVIAQQRSRCVDCLLGQVAHTSRRGGAAWAEQFGRLAVHPLWGWPILAAVLFGMYMFVGRLGAGVMVNWMEGVLFKQWLLPVATRLAGYIPVPLVVEALVGPYGVISMALSYGIAIVMPIVLTFFFAFSILEDSGYLPRLAVMLDRPFKAMGLNGKAVLPMVLGLGCDTMATLTTRILETRKERVMVTLLLALGVPCSAQLGVLLGMVALLPPSAIAVWGAVVVVTMFVVGWLAARLLPGQRADFILELPPIRMPQLGNIVIKTVARLEWYLKEVLPLFVLGTFILLALDKTGALNLLEQWAAPLVVNGLGLPPQTTGAFIIGFLRRDYGAAGLFTLARSGALDAGQLVVSLVVITLFVPCIANVMVIAKEHGWKTTAWVVAFIFPFAFGVGVVLNLALHALGITFA